MKDDSKKLEVEYPSSSDDGEPEKKRQQTDEQSSEVESEGRVTIDCGTEDMIDRL